MSNIERLDALKLNVPAWFEREDFQEWLNERGKPATWHVKGAEPNDYSDIFMWFEDGEGSDSDMPEKVWDELCALCKTQAFRAGVIWLTNLRG